AAGALAATAAEQARARDTAEELAKAARRLTEALERSPQAREQLLRDFEEERAALLARLREKEDAAPILEERDALRRELERLKGRLESLELERDAQTRALADEGLRARESAAESARRDRELQEAVEARRLAESAAQDLRRQLEALARHLASLESRAGPDAQEWAREREQLRASLRAKDEMLSMLSETFSGLLRRSGVEPDAR
ncbi:MAG TPA: hypothetical protein VNI01_16545, partial [Elusimicrobiota bacterium]|nr:hypothetical protein [Elusimicrobiota bacterium]